MLRLSPKARAHLDRAAAAFDDGTASDWLEVLDRELRAAIDVGTADDQRQILKAIRSVDGRYDRSKPLNNTEARAYVTGVHAALFGDRS